MRKLLFICLLMCAVKPSGTLANDSVSLLYTLAQKEGSITKEEQDKVIADSDELVSRLRQFPRFRHSAAPVIEYLREQKALWCPNVPKAGGLRDHVFVSDPIVFHRLSDGVRRGSVCRIAYFVDRNALRSVIFPLRESDGKIQAAAIQIGGFEGYLLLELCEKQLTEFGRGAGVLKE
jgi:hypothetical protein